MSRVMILLALVSACGGAQAAAPGDVVVAPVVASAPASASVAPPAPVVVSAPVVKPAADVPLRVAMRRQLLASCSASNENDAMLFRDANDKEDKSDYDGARRGYYELIAKEPRSALVPYAYLAFADIFFEEAESDPTKWSIAQQAYEKVLAYAPPGNLAYAYAWHKVGLVFAKTADGPHALDAQVKALRATAAFPALPLALEVGDAARVAVVDAYANAGDPARAMSFFNGVDPANATRQVVLLGSEYVRRGRVSEVASLYDASLASKADAALCDGARDAAAALGARTTQDAVRAVQLIEGRRRAACP